MADMIKQLAKRLEISEAAARAAAELLDAGNTVPFIARYRKEKTGGLDDEKLRALERELASLRQLEERREDILRLIGEQGLLTPDLERQIREAESVTKLEDIYLPYRPKRRTRAMIAREAGLLPLAQALKSPDVSWPEVRALARKLAGSEAFPDEEKALGGASDILAEALAESLPVRERLRKKLKREAFAVSQAKRKEEASVYEHYYDFSCPWHKLKGYQVLALNRGEKEGWLKVSVDDGETDAERELMGFFRDQPAKRPIFKELCRDCWKRLLKPSLETELRNEKTAEAHEEAMRIFSENLRAALLAPPLRGKVLLALDPGFRNGCKLAVTDAQGKVLDTGTIYPLPPQNRAEDAARQIEGLCALYHVDALALGNGTATRETENFLKKSLRGEAASLPLLIVNEAGASVYSASELASKEFPDLDVARRSAVSLARRVQDPLAELVKVEPKALGLGQYQHDMNQKALEERLDRVVEDCVNLVGCDLNTASAELLQHIAGIGGKLADNIVAYREENGAFASRAELKKVPRLGPKAFEQCAGFLRIPGGREFLDNTSVHPESYPAAKSLLRKLGLRPDPERPQLTEDLAALLPPAARDETAAALGIGRPTLDDILEAMSKPGRDPRSLRTLETRSSLAESIEDLKPGMRLPGVVRNVTAFGAFVDIGVHQDGLVHISELSDQFVQNPSAVARSGQKVEVVVLDVDVRKKRISLSMKPSRLKASAK